MSDPTKRFSTRVENYVKYRPHYPPAVIELLQQRCELTASSVVADIGSGTGILSALLLRSGCQVLGIEPNDAMRAAAEQLLAHEPGFVSIAAAAEQTTLDDQSIDLITAGQAFHWFDVQRTRDEWRRILRPGGWVALIWNQRHTRTAFLEDYEELLKRHSSDYARVNHKDSADEQLLRTFFAPQEMHTAAFANVQQLDLPGLEGRLFSSSYMPEPHDPRAEHVREDLRALVEAHQRDGTVALEYDTMVYYGQL